jgi:hypothetical protein
MWRFVKKKSSSGRVKHSKRAGKRRFSTMARRKIRYARMARRSYRRGGTMGMGFLNKKFLPMGGFIQGALLGAGAATIADNTGLSNVVPYGKYVAGAAVGGIIPGIAGVFIRDMVKGVVNLGGPSNGGVY